MPSQPGSVATFSQPRCRGRSPPGRGPGRAGRTAPPRTHPRRAPGARAAGSSRGSSRRPCTGTGRPRRRGRRPARARAPPTASPARPQTAVEPPLRCDTWSRAPEPAARIAAIDSSSDANSPSHSLRMWVAYRPPRRAVAVTSASTSSGGACMPGRVDQPGREPDRAGVERRLDLGTIAASCVSGGRLGLRAHDRRRGPSRGRRGTRRSARAAAPRRGRGTPRTSPSARRGRWRRSDSSTRLAAGGVIGASVSPQFPDSWVV